jgi:tetratricopeptide (TPR) repeat protein
MRVKSFLLSGILFMIFYLVFAAPGFGQYREYYVYGKVVDTDNQPLAGVEVRLQDTNTSRSYKVSTNKKGDFKLIGLPHGIYQATISKEGYKTVTAEWNFASPQDRIQKVEIETIVMVSEEKIQRVERAKQAQADFNEATAKVQQGDFEGAIIILKKMIEDTPEDANAYYLLGISYLKKGMLPEAAEAFTRTMELVPKFAGAYHHLGLVSKEQKELERAIQYYEKALELEPKRVDSLYNIGLILFELNRIPEASSYFERALEINPDDAEILEMAGRCLIHQGDYAQAIEYLEKAKERHSDQEKLKFLEDLIGKLKQLIEEQ